MGYTTSFSGSMKLSRPLTMKEARDWLELCALDRTEMPEGAPDTYLQWVPSCDLEHLVWDGGEKFYLYVECLKWIALWLHERGITMDGRIDWSGEDVSDTGFIVMEGSVISVIEGSRPESPRYDPLTLRRLGEMALEAATAEVPA